MAGSAAPCVQTSGSLTPIGGKVVKTIKHRYSEFEELRLKLVSRHGEISVLDEKFPRKYMYGNASEVQRLPPRPPRTSSTGSPNNHSG